MSGDRNRRNQSLMESVKHSPTSLSLSSIQSTSQPSLGHRNVFLILAQREVSPRTKHCARKIWGSRLKYGSTSVEVKCETSDAKLDLYSWIETQSLHHLSAQYSPLCPPPRSTIAASFSPDGKTLASTHGDHTVKIVNCYTGKCLKVLSGHRRTPWVVRFHPLYSDILASGSLDHEVRLWDARTSNCIGSRDFFRPIASIAFHAKGEFLAVASGHKLYIWNYNKKDEGSSPTVILRTRRSLRAVHFHPHGAPCLLTAEVNSLDSADSPLTHATSSGYSPCPPALFFVNINPNCCQHSESRISSSSCLFWPAVLSDDGRVCLLPSDWASGFPNDQLGSGSSNQSWLGSDGFHRDQLATPMDICPGETSSSSLIRENTTADYLSSITGLVIPDEMPNSSLISRTSAGNFEIASAIPVPSSRSGTGPAPWNGNSEGVNNQLSPTWELPFLQGLLMSQSHAVLQSNSLSNNLHGLLPFATGPRPENFAGETPYTQSNENMGISFPIVGTSGHSRAFGRQQLSSTSPSTSAPGGVPLGAQTDENDTRTVSFEIGSELATSLFAAGAADLPCTVRLRIWRHDIKDPCAVLNPEACRLTISHAVLCSEMGAHFSPCGRFLVVCVACLLPQVETDHGSQFPSQYDSTGAGSSPTRHPLPSRRILYELRIYSLEEATFGKVLASRAIRAAHCLTSIQFSPTSEHVLLAYGRRHNSLLRGIFLNGENATPIYTILEVYRVSDMELVRIVPSAEDEVNVACFNPSPGGGLVYGTKEGKLRILQYIGAQNPSSVGMNSLVDEHMLEIQKYCPES